MSGADERTRDDLPRGVDPLEGWEADARLSAYALGELGAAERAAVEDLLATEPAARERVEELRGLAADLSNALGREYTAGEAPELSSDARAAIAAAAEEPRRRKWYARPVVRVAASLLVLVGLASATVLVLQGGRYGGEIGFLTASEEVASRPAASAASPKYAKKLRLSDDASLQGLGYVDSEEPAEDLRADDDGDVLYDIEIAELEEALVAEDPVIRDRLLERARQLTAEGEEDAFLHRVQLEELQDFADDLGVDLRGLGDREASTEDYAAIRENDFLSPWVHRESTFSIDVDTASYANVRRFLRDGDLPPADAVRIEELVNYFPYDYALPKGEHPFAVDVEVGAAPWAQRHRLVRIGLRSSPLDLADRRPSNLVFLLDVSGSMDSPDKLPLVKQSLRLLVEELDHRDSVAIVVYAGAAGVVLEPTGGEMDLAILSAIERLDAGGSTNGGEGIVRAYQLARDHFLEDGNNRVILATDGDFNVGVTGDGALEDLIVEQARSGVFLTVLGFGTGNLKDDTMEALADKGNGHYAYIDSLSEARKVLVGEVGATLETVAKDVKIQVEFDPRRVAAYRLIGYENRLMAAEDFDDDTKDAGEIGAGHRVTALYEVVPADEGLAIPGWTDRVRREADDARARDAFASDVAPSGGGLGELRLRYKAPQGTESRLLTRPLGDSLASFQELSADTRFAASVAAYGMLLRGSKYAGTARWDDVVAWASAALGADEGGYRGEFRELARAARRLVEERSTGDERR